MKLEVGDVFEVVHDGCFHIGLQTDLVGKVMRVVSIDDFGVRNVTGDARVRDVDTSETYTLANDDHPVDEFISRYNVLNGAQEPTGAVKSDGGSSSYYDMEIPEWLVELIIDRRGDEGGASYIKTEELITTVFNNDFDFGNIFKSLVRAHGAYNGAGKAGNDVPYECRKIKYSADKIIDSEARKGG